MGNTTSEKLTDEQKIRIFTELLCSHEKIDLSRYGSKNEIIYMTIQIHSIQHGHKSKILTISYTVFGNKKMNGNRSASVEYFFDTYLPKKYGSWKEFMFIKGIK